MDLQTEGDPDHYVVADGREYRITRHTWQRMQERSVSEELVADVLMNWVAKKYSAKNQSIGYFGVVRETNRMIKVAVSDYSYDITTVHPDRDATLNYREGTFDYFDEVRDSRNAS